MKKNPIEWLQFKWKYRKSIKQLSDAIGDRKLILITDDEEKEK